MVDGTGEVRILRDRDFDFSTFLKPEITDIINVKSEEKV